jgi:oligopeptide/dipeptide ABC transporter ATP-binding protein
MHVVKHISDFVAVMYAGRVVEAGEAATVYASPQHPYTRELVRVAHAELMTKTTDVDQEPLEAPASVGCSYRNTCPLHVAICDSVRPELRPSPSGALAACHVVAPAA